ncbi:hypothetical protein [Nonomuraea jabiensis]|uniref:hypothetical protein n=1 Tax=Nonomuraea jabiensis TaxID=882448 RepID=UPI00368FFB36
MSDAARLLLYRTVTHPAPLQAGSADEPSSNSIDVIVSSPDGRKVYCKKIDIAVPVGEPRDAGAYFTENPQSSTDNDKWQIVSVELVSGRELGLDNDTNYFHVILEPPQGGPSQLRLIDKPMTCTINGKLAADATGSLLTCQVTETSSTTDHNYTRKDPLMLTLPTAEPVFYLRNFLASAPDKPTVPRTKFNAGDQVYLTWESNGDSYHLYDGDGTILNPDNTSATSHLIPAGKIVNDTTFTLKASKQNATGFETVDQYATLTITIRNPTLSEMTVTNGTHTPWVQGTVDGKEGRVTFSDMGVEVTNNAGSLGTLEAEEANLNGVRTSYVQGRNFDDGWISFPSEGLNVKRAGGAGWGTVFADKADLNGVNTSWVQGRNSSDGWISFPSEGLNVKRAGGEDLGTVFADKANLTGVNTSWVQGKSDDAGWIGFHPEGLNVYQGQGYHNWGTLRADKADLNTLEVKYP